MFFLSLVDFCHKIVLLLLVHNHYVIVSVKHSILFVIRRLLKLHSNSAWFIHRLLHPNKAIQKVLQMHFQGLQTMDANFMINRSVSWNKIRKEQILLSCEHRMWRQPMQETLVEKFFATLINSNISANAWTMELRNCRRAWKRRFLLFPSIFSYSVLTLCGRRGWTSEVEPNP